jgi:hypothetical protein
VEVSGYLVAMNLVATAFMGAIGFATAASVRVGNAVGRQDPFGTRAAGWVAAGVAAAIMVVLGLAFVTFPEALSAIYASDPGITAVAVPTLIVAALVLVPDGTQAVLMGALRGLADVWPATGAGAHAVHPHRLRARVAAPGVALPCRVPARGRAGLSACATTTGHPRASARSISLSRGQPMPSSSRCAMVLAKYSGFAPL